MYPHRLVVYQHIQDATPADRPERPVFIGWRVVLAVAVAAFLAGMHYGH